MIGLDRGLNPPEPQTHADCERCGERHDLGDMWYTADDRYHEHPYCSECYELARMEESDE